MTLPSLRLSPPRAAVPRGWSSSCSGTGYFFAPGTECREPRRVFSEDAAALSAPPSTSDPHRSLPQLELDVGANMTSGRRLPLVLLFLGIVLAGVTDCNQGEFRLPPDSQPEGVQPTSVCPRSAPRVSRSYGDGLRAPHATTASCSSNSPNSREAPTRRTSRESGTDSNQTVSSLLFVSEMKNARGNSQANNIYVKKKSIFIDDKL